MERNEERITDEGASMALAAMIDEGASKAVAVARELYSEWSVPCAIACAKAAYESAITWPVQRAVLEFFREVIRDGHVVFDREREDSLNPANNEGLGDLVEALRDLEQYEAFAFTTAHEDAAYPRLCAVRAVLAEAGVSTEPTAA